MLGGNLTTDMFDWLKKASGESARKRQPEAEFKPAKLPPRRIEQTQPERVTRDPVVVDAKRREAQCAADAFAETLATEGFPLYAKQYRAISSALEAGNLERAIELDSAIPRGGMGSLSDIYPKDEDRWGRTYSAASHAITGLRVYLSYGIHLRRHNDNSHTAS